MKIYVATSVLATSAAIEAATALEAEGHTISFKWWLVEASTLPTEKWPEQAEADLQGIRDADALVALFPTDLPYRGTLAEVGAALILGKPVYMIGGFIPPMIFSYSDLVLRRLPRAAGAFASLEERVWATAFFEGEGNIAPATRTGVPRLQVSQSEPHALDRLARLRVGLGEVGRIYGPYEQSSLGGQPFRKLQVHRQHELKKAVCSMWPYLGRGKRRQIENALNWIPGVSLDGLR